jgi:hypothetical protein
VLDPSAGEPVAQVLNSHADDNTVGVVVDEPVPDLFSAGAERMTCKLLCRKYDRSHYEAGAYIKSSSFECIVLITNLGYSPAVIIRQEDLLTLAEGDRGEEKESPRKLHNYVGIF